MQKGNKIAIIGLLIFGIFLIAFGYLMPIGMLGEQLRYYSAEQIANFYFLGNLLRMIGGILVAGTTIVLIVSRLKLSKTCQGSIGLIFSGIVLSAISWVNTYDIYGYEFSYTTFPFSFIGYPLIALGFGILFYSYFTSHLGVEIVQTKDDTRTVSTAKVVWKENDTKPDTSKPTEKKESVYEQMQKQHTLIDSMESETTAEQQSIRYCRYCGAKNKSDAVFCETCGKRF